MQVFCEVRFCLPGACLPAPGVLRAPVPIIYGGGAVFVTFGFHSQTGVMRHEATDTIDQSWIDVDEGGPL
jgi:hypothetical protein